MQQDDNDDTTALSGLLPQGWIASSSVVTQHVQRTLMDAVRIANQVLNKPSERTVMQLFQTMIDRTAFPSACQENDSMTVH